MAVEQAEPGGCNEGLVRGGLLQVVFVSDENDESPGYDTSVDYWTDYWTRIVNAHGNASSITVSAVGGPTPSGCSGADPGFGYDKLIEGTGGELVSICDDWASQIGVIADAGVNNDTFVLSAIPDPTTIQVWINGVWADPVLYHYDPSPNAVVFDSGLPNGGDTVDILYELAGE
jgi:hypothetical protein